MREIAGKRRETASTLPIPTAFLAKHSFLFILRAIQKFHTLAIPRAQEHPLINFMIFIEENK
jgi:hypothetical protein